MREAVGGSILFYIILGFLAIFIVFIALIMNYAACYRASNYVLTMLERTEGHISKGNPSDKAGDNTLYGALKERKYYNTLKVCCYEFKTSADEKPNSIYKIETEVKFDLPMIGVSLPLKIRNETKTIYGAGCTNPEYNCG